MTQRWTQDEFEMQIADMIDINELRRLTVDCYWPTSPVSINEILDRLEAAESDGLEQARLLGMSGEREAALLSKLEAVEKERNALRAKIEAMEKQEPDILLKEYREKVAQHSDRANAALEESK